MHDLEITNFFECLDEYAEVYGRELTISVKQIYWVGLKNFTFSSIKTALNIWVENNKHFPRLSELREKVKRLQPVPTKEIPYNLNEDLRRLNHRYTALLQEMAVSTPEKKSLLYDELRSLGAKLTQLEQSKQLDVNYPSKVV